MQNKLFSPCPGLTARVAGASGGVLHAYHGGAGSNALGWGPALDLGGTAAPGVMEGATRGICPLQLICFLHPSWVDGVTAGRGTGDLPGRAGGLAVLSFRDNRRGRGGQGSSVAMG